MPSAHPSCTGCGRKLTVKRTWRRVLLHCQACSVDYPMETYAQQIDDELEERLALIPCDRI